MLVITIQYDLTVATDVRLAIYDLLGREVLRLVNQQMEAGYHHAVWNARDNHGCEVSTGIYFVVAVTPEGTERSVQSAAFHTILG